MPLLLPGQFALHLAMLERLVMNSVTKEQGFLKILERRVTAASMQEYCVKKNDRVELVAMLGLFQLLVSIIQMYPFCSSLLITNQ